jgi:hypothetical protein
MMDKTARKAAIADWKRKDQPMGIFAVRCDATGAVWVGASKTLDKVWNKLSFTLRQGSGRAGRPGSGAGRKAGRLARAPRRPCALESDRSGRSRSVRII